MKKRVILTSVLLLTLFLIPFSLSEEGLSGDTDYIVREIIAARTLEEARTRDYADTGGVTDAYPTTLVSGERELPPLKVIEMTKEHSMWSAGCVAGMPEPFNKVGKFYRDVVDCATGKVLERQLIVTNGGYCNFRCRNRYREHCINDGTFDKYYREFCPGITIPTPGVEPKKITDLTSKVEVSDENINALTSQNKSMPRGPSVSADESPVEKKLQETTTFTTERDPEKEEKIIVDENSDMFNNDCQTNLTAPFNQVKRIERMVYSCADDTMLQKQEIYTNGDFCEFYCIDMKTEMCTENSMDVYYREECGLSGEQVKLVEESYRKIKIHYAQQEQKIKITVVAAKEESLEEGALTEAIVADDVSVIVEEKKLEIQKAGIKKQIGVMPDLVKEAVKQEKLELKGMELDIDTVKEEAIYRVKAMEKVKLFAVISVEKPVDVTISAETAEIKEKTEPFWSFLTIKEEKGETAA